jgi:hypothetical protein
MIYYSADYDVCQEPKEEDRLPVSERGSGNTPRLVHFSDWY